MDVIINNSGGVNYRNNFALNIFIISALMAFPFGFDFSFDAVGCSFFLSLVLSTFFLFKYSSGHIRLISVYYLFSVLFFCLIPWLHYTSGRVVWVTSQFSPNILLSINFIIISANILTYFVYGVFFELKSSRSISRHIVGGSASPIFRMVGASSVGLVGLYVLYGSSISSLFIRELSEIQETEFSGDSAVLALMKHIFRLLPVFSFFLSYSFPVGKLTKTFLFFALAVAVFPTGVPRYLVGVVYIPLLLLFVPRLRAASAFIALLLAAILFVFPFLEQFRRLSETDAIKLFPDSEFFFAAHFDAFENFCSAFDQSFITNGFQLLGTVLFFVPRSIWPNKPFGSGYTLAHNLHYGFDNLSMPWLGEGFVNFGVLGIFLYAVFAAFLMAKIDSTFLSSGKKFWAGNYNAAIYFYALGSLVFVLRGDSMSAVAYVSGGVIIAKLISFGLYLG